MPSAGGAPSPYAPAHAPRGREQPRAPPPPSRDRARPPPSSRREQLRVTSPAKSAPASAPCARRRGRRGRRRRGPRRRRRPASLPRACSVCVIARHARAFAARSPRSESSITTHLLASSPPCARARGRRSAGRASLDVVARDHDVQAVEPRAPDDRVGDLLEPPRVAAEQMPTAMPGAAIASSISSSTPGRRPCLLDDGAVDHRLGVLQRSISAAPVVVARGPRLAAHRRGPRLRRGLEVPPYCLPPPTVFCNTSARH